jgi:putative hydrolase
MKEKNTEAVINAMNKYKINILTHPGDKIPLNTEKIAEAAEKTNTVLEINNSHSHLNAEEIKIAKNYDVKFVINSDSHIKDKIGSYEKGLKAAIEAGLDLNRIINLK